VQEFDHEAFRGALAGPAAGEEAAQEAGTGAAPAAKASEGLVADLALASSVMLRVAVAVAQEYHLEMADWADINQACSDALHIVPVCYALQRALPGALNVARTMRFLPAPDEGDDANPWRSEEGRRLFEKAHGLEWAQVELFTSQDEAVRCCFAGAFVVRRVTTVQCLAIVALDVLRVDEAPAGFPAKSLVEEDGILWEVEESLGSLLEPGVVIEADWCELQNELCFISLLKAVSPQWCSEQGMAAEEG